MLGLVWKPLDATPSWPMSIPLESLWFPANRTRMRIQEVWREAASQVAPGLVDDCRTYRRWKSKERQLVRYYLGDGTEGTNRWDTLVEGVPRIFATFVKQAGIKQP